MRLILSFITLVFIISCQDEPVKNKPKTVNISHEKTVEEAPEQQPEILTENPFDTIVYDTVSVPAGDEEFMAKILGKGFFHGDEVWEDAHKEKWFGLFKNRSGYYVAPTSISTKRVHDIIVDEDETEKTGWEVEPANKDSLILLIGGLKFLSEHKVENAALPKYDVIPGDTVRFTYMNIDYRLFATGGKRKVQENPPYYEVWNYKLYLSASKNGQIITDLLAAQPFFDDTMIYILFAGDIDGDGLLDLIIDTSNHYNAEVPTLYLSKPAENDRLVKIAGLHVSVGC